MSVSAHCVLTVVPFANDRQTVASGQSSAYFDKATMADRIVAFLANVIARFHG